MDGRVDTTHVLALVTLKITVDLVLAIRAMATIKTLIRTLIKTSIKTSIRPMMEPVMMAL